MTWVKMDDRLPDNLKVAPLSDAAFRAYVEAICYAASTLTDGLVPASVAKKRGWSKHARALVAAGLWEPAEGGHSIHDYLEYNPTREQVEVDRSRKHEGKVAGGLARAAQAAREGGKFTSRTTSSAPADDQQNHQHSTSSLLDNDDADESVKSHFVNTENVPDGGVRAGMQVSSNSGVESTNPHQQRTSSATSSATSRPPAPSDPIRSGSDLDLQPPQTESRARGSARPAGGGVLAPPGSPEAQVNAAHDTFHATMSEGTAVLIRETLALHQHDAPDRAECMARHVQDADAALAAKRRDQRITNPWRWWLKALEGELGGCGMGEEAADAHLESLSLPPDDALDDLRASGQIPELPRPGLQRRVRVLTGTHDDE